MEATVIKINGGSVHVETDIGDFVGVWRSSVPAALKRYILELDCDDIITTENLRLSSIHTPYIKNIDGSTCLNGYVEEIEDNVMIFRLQKTIMMLKTSEQVERSVFEKRFVCVSLQTINLYDTGLC